MNWSGVTSMKYIAAVLIAIMCFLPLQSAASAETVKLNVPYKSQLTPVYAPFGCEGASLLMGLTYKGYTKKSLKTFLDKMPKSKKNPFLGFASGNPYKNVNGVFQSIFPQPLTTYGKTYSKNVKNATGYTPKQLKAQLKKGNPVVVYVTLNFQAPKMEKWSMGTAGKVKTVDNMHVMTLVGYNSTGYYVADPNFKTSAKGKYWVSKAKFEKAYNALRYAVVIS